MHGLFQGTSAALLGMFGGPITVEWTSDDGTQTSTVTGVGVVRRATAEQLRDGLLTRQEVSIVLSGCDVDFDCGRWWFTPTCGAFDGVTFCASARDGSPLLSVDAVGAKIEFAAVKC